MGMLTEKFGLVLGLAPAADRFNTSPYTDIVSLKNAEAVSFIVVHDGGTTGVGSLLATACDNVSASNTAAVAGYYRKKTTGASATWGDVTSFPTTGVLTTAGESTIFEIMIRAADLPDGKPFVRLQTAESVNDPVNGCVIAILHGAKYQGLTQPDYLS